MAEAQSIRCPNCGGSVSGAGIVTCPYCGSPLEVKAAGAGGAKPACIFENLPGVEIKRDTKDIPFGPQVLFSQLEGGEPAGPLRGEADAIVAVARRTQDAINREDLDSYMSCFTTEDPQFRAKAQAAAHAQFITTDMKRYTVSVDFRKLTAQQAEAIVTIEAFIWIDPGPVNHMQVSFDWSLRKEADQWVIYASGMAG
jgi:ketosteroid isomerase-like protein